MLVHFTRVGSHQPVFVNPQHVLYAESPNPGTNDSVRLVLIENLSILVDGTIEAAVQKINTAGRPKTSAKPVDDEPVCYPGTFQRM